jgi:tetratricopeptide (TPR) repeat protein
MKKILVIVILSLVLMVCFTTLAWASGLDDLKAGNTALFQGKNYDEAIRLYSKAIESGELSREQLSLAYVLRGIAWGTKGDTDKAMVDFNKAIEIDPKNARAYYYRGYAWRTKGDNDKAIADFTKVIEIDPKYTAAYYYRGYAWQTKGDNDKAIADYTKAIEINPKDTHAYINRGWAWDAKGDHDKAQADWDKTGELGHQ